MENASIFFSPLFVPDGRQRAQLHGPERREETGRHADKHGKGQ